MVEALCARGPGEPLGEAPRGHLGECAACRLTAEQLEGLDEALAGLSVEPVPVPSFDGLARRARVAARGRRQRRAIRRVLPLGVALAAAVALTAGLSRLITRRETSRLASAGEVVDGARGTAQVVLAGGARLTVTSGRTVVEISDRLHAVLRLETGSVFVVVPHVEGGSLVVRTEEAEVRVRGTQFQVARLGPSTRVDVLDGTVEVQDRAGEHASFLLRKGESRSIGTPASPRDDEAEAIARLAWKLLRDGDRSGALERYRRALTLLPASATPLWADNASAQLALLIERDDLAAGVAAWQGYLQRFPAGVHADVARERLARLANAVGR
jgi:ferric-dicitrate binding protein FerR (iron transport regulator)